MGFIEWPLKIKIECANDANPIALIISFLTIYCKQYAVLPRLGLEELQSLLH